MLPPLVIGLLVLYGEVEKFLGVEFKNPEAIHQLVWLGCVVISLIWIANVSRLAQLTYWHRDTMRQCERKLKLRGHRKIAKIDGKSFISKVLRHSKLRLVGFGIYFSLLLHFILKSMDFIAVLPWFIDWHAVLIAWFAISGGVGTSYCIWCLYFKDLSPSSRETPMKCQHTASDANSQPEPKV